MRRLGLVMIAVTLAAAGCSSKARTTRAPSAPPAPAAPVRASGTDVTGKWAGKWIGYGIVDIPRNEDATAELIQRGSRGFGRIVFEGTGAAEAVPDSLRRAGLTGTRVQFDVSGRNLTMTHELGGQLFTIDFKIDGDRMVGRVRDTETPLRVILERVKSPAQAQAPVAMAPPAPAPPPGPAAPAAPVAPVAPPVPAMPEPPKQEPQVATAPPPAAEPVPPPVEAERPAPKDFVAVPEVNAIHFDFDRSQIRSADAKILDANSDWLRDNPDTQVLIEGHCDERGTAEYNLALGERRARAARDYLVSRGIAADRISLVSFGEERPVCTEHNEACWARNRRAEFLIKSK